MTLVRNGSAEAAGSPQTLGLEGISELLQNWESSPRPWAQVRLAAAERKGPGPVVWPHTPPLPLRRAQNSLLPTPNNRYLKSVRCPEPTQGRVLQVSCALTEEAAGQEGWGQWAAVCRGERPPQGPTGQPRAPFTGSKSLPPLFWHSTATHSARALSSPLHTT